MAGRFLEWLGKCEFFVYIALYLLFWIFVFGATLPPGFWWRLALVGTIFTFFARFVLASVASLGRFNDEPIKLSFWLDLALLVASIVLLAFWRQTTIITMVFLGAFFGLGSEAFAYIDIVRRRDEL